jgi:hypothetical protein
MNAYSVNVSNQANAEDYFIQYIFCCMERSLLRGEARPLYDKLFVIWFEVWQGLNDYVGENKIKLCGDIFKSKITKGDKNDHKIKVG